MPTTMKSMLPAKWNWKTDENNEFVSLQRAMNNLLEGFTKDWELPAFAPAVEKGLNWYPRLDMIEMENEYSITIELPGLEAKDIEVFLTGDMLTIKGEKLLEKADKNDTWFHSERAWGKFQRVVRLPAPVVFDKVVTRFKQGVLNLTLPKTVEARESVRKIQIKE